jgi:Putative peptidoglycan binding domain
MFMIYKNLTAATIAVAVCIFAGSSAMAQRHGGFQGGGFHSGGFHSGAFHGGPFHGGPGPGGISRSFSPGGPRFAHGMTRSGTFRDGDRGRDRHHRRDFDDRFVFFGNSWDPFYDYPYSYYGYYPYQYGYDPYDQPVYQAGPRYTGSLVEQVQIRLARAGYYHGAIDGVSGNATRRAIRDYERGHGLPPDGQIRGALLTKMGLG